MLAINPRALLHDQTEVKIGLAQRDDNRGYMVYIRASLGLSRLQVNMPIGRTDEPTAPMQGDLEYEA